MTYRTSDYERADRFAGLCATVALKSAEETLDIVRICEELHCPIPIDADDLRSLSLVCRTWGIRCILDDEPAAYWTTCREETPATA